MQEEQGSYRARSRAEREKARRARRRRKKVVMRRASLALLVLAAAWVIMHLGSGEGRKQERESLTKDTTKSALTATSSTVYSTSVDTGNSAKLETDLEIDEQFLTPNPYSRPGKALEKVEKIVVHYVGNPGTSAQANRNYFESLKSGKGTSASSHFVIGLDGEILQCIPLDEISYASNHMNSCSISIECCHPGEDGQFTDETYEALVHLTADLCKAYNLTEEQVIRHYDVTGKICPKYFVDHEDAWEKFRDDVERKMNE